LIRCLISRPGVGDLAGVVDEAARWLLDRRTDPYWAA